MITQVLMVGWRPYQSHFKDLDEYSISVCKVIDYEIYNDPKQEANTHFIFNSLIQQVE